jgi:digeranylgeranylglycerophospholipid reductase
MREKVAIIGAGTSGLIAARDLAKYGIATTVYDQKTKLGYPQKASGIISINGLKTLGIGYSKAVTNTLYGANIHAGNAMMRVHSKVPQAHILDRVILNDICCAESEKEGAVVRKGVQVDSDMLDSLHKDNVIVGADGPVSLVARHFSLGSIKKNILTYKADFEVSVERKEVVDLFFDNRISPKFFAWMCPNSKDVLEVGIGVDSKFGNSKSAFDKFIKQEYVLRRIGKARVIDGYASMIPMQTARRVVDEKREVLLVGDAAGQVKPTTGGGIVFGGNAAMMAARTIRDHVREGSSLKAYERQFRKNFGMELMLHRAIRGAYANFDVRGIEFMIRMSKMFGLENFLSKHGDMDRPSLMLKRFLLRGLVK